MRNTNQSLFMNPTSSILALWLIDSSLSIPIQATKVEIEGINYNLFSNSTAEVTYLDNYKRYSGHIVVPESIFFNDSVYTVTAIGEEAFDYCSDLTGIELPNTIKYIRDKAFHFSGITKIELPDSLITIGEYAFWSCDYIESIVIPEKVSSLRDYAFYSCDRLKKIIILSDDYIYFYTRTFSGLNTNSDGPVIYYKSSATLQKLNKVWSGRTKNVIDYINIDVDTDVTSARIKCTPYTNGYTKTGIILNGTEYVANESGEIMLDNLSPITQYSITPFADYENGRTTDYDIGFTTKFIDYIISIDPQYLTAKIKISTTNKSISEIGVYVKCEDPGIDQQYFNADINGIVNLSWTYNSDILLYPYCIYNDQICTDTKYYFVNQKYFSLNGTVLTSSYTTATLKITSSDINVKVIGIRMNDKEYLADEDGIISLSKLSPNGNYSYNIMYKVPDKNDVLLDSQNYTFETTKFSNEVTATTLSTTQTTAKIKVESTCDEISDFGIIYKNKNYKPDSKGTITLSKLSPSTKLYYYPYARIPNDEYGSIHTFGSVTATTQKLNLKVSAESISPITMRINGSWTQGDAVVKGYYGQLDGTEIELNDKISEIVVPYTPGANHNVAFGVSGDGWSFLSPVVTITMPELEWSGSESVPTSTTSARLVSGTNLPDGVSGTGIEWRRIDAPDLIASSKVSCAVVDGKIVGSLHKLKDDVYYKFRPYYTATDGTKYYGEWTGIFTGDADVFFKPDVRTHATLQNEENVTLKGYVLSGSEPIVTQGFEYRAIGTSISRSADDWKRIEADGILMEAQLENLTPGTDYACRAFATTAGGTYYGDEQYFTTKGALAAIDDITVDNKGLTIALRENPVRGDAHVKVTGEQPIAQCHVMSLMGATVMNTEIIADGTWQQLHLDNYPKGMYLLNIRCGKDTETIKIILNK